jgi:hypothetical protein
VNLSYALEQRTVAFGRQDCPMRISVAPTMACVGYKTAASDATVNVPPFAPSFRFRDLGTTRIEWSRWPSVVNFPMQRSRHGCDDSNLLT